MAYGLLFDYEYCTNCGACRVSCKEEHNYPVGKDGIKIFADGPWKVDEDHWNFNYIPVLTDLCDLCADRTERGREPLCVHHCLSNIISYGTVEELAKKLDAKPKQMLVVPQYLPHEAKGEFVPGQNKAAEHHAAHIDVQGTGSASYAVHRHDTKVDEFSTEA